MGRRQAKLGVGAQPALLVAAVPALGCDNAADESRLRPPARSGAAVPVPTSNDSAVSEFERRLLERLRALELVVAVVVADATVVATVAGADTDAAPAAPSEEERTPGARCRHQAG
jgi:hypothetical protein